MNELTPIGKQIEEFRILGRELDSSERCVAVDMVTRMNDLSSWVVSIVTKRQYIDQEFAEFHLATDDPEAYFSALKDVESMESHPPFVVNDTEITDEVLNRKFKHRLVEADLAEAMSPYVETDSSSEDEVTVPDDEA